MTGMPAWGVTHDDEILWDVVAFLRKLPEITADQYQALVSAATKTHDGSDPIVQRDPFLGQLSNSAHNYSPLIGSGGGRLVIASLAIRSVAMTRSGMMPMRIPRDGLSGGDLRQKG